MWGGVGMDTTERFNGIGFPTRVVQRTPCIPYTDNGLRGCKCGLLSSVFLLRADLVNGLTVNIEGIAIATNHPTNNSPEIEQKIENSPSVYFYTVTFPTFIF